MRSWLAVASLNMSRAYQCEIRTTDHDLLRVMNSPSCKSISDIQTSDTNEKKLFY